jgi:adenosylmethionine-8-amino-7-oxononanoate aminotransferase
VARAISAGAGGGLAHGPTFMGNPLACAVANASIGLLRAGDWPAEVRRIETGLRAGLEPLRAAPGVVDVRVLGAIGVVQLDHDVDVPRATAAAAAAGVWLRPFRDLIYTMPPYVTDDADVGRITRGITAAVSAS